MVFSIWSELKGRTSFCAAPGETGLYVMDLESQEPLDPGGSANTSVTAVARLHLKFVGVYFYLLKYHSET